MTDLELSEKRTSPEHRGKYASAQALPSRQQRAPVYGAVISMLPAESVSLDTNQASARNVLGGGLNWTFARAFPEPSVGTVPKRTGRHTLPSVTNCETSRTYGVLGAAPFSARVTVIRFW